VAEAAEQILDPSLMKKFTVDCECTQVGTNQTFASEELDISSLWLPEELLPDVINMIIGVTWFDFFLSDMLSSHLFVRASQFHLPVMVDML
jgi:hypothetical protein